MPRKFELLQNPADDSRYFLLAPIDPQGPQAHSGSRKLQPAQLRWLPKQQPSLLEELSPSVLPVRVAGVYREFSGFGIWLFRV